MTNTHVLCEQAVENGLEAVNITGTRKYDMILMDCNMPIMDGWQVRGSSAWGMPSCRPKRSALCERCA